MLCQLYYYPLIASVPLSLPALTDSNERCVSTAYSVSAALCSSAAISKASRLSSGAITLGLGSHALDEGSSIAVDVTTRNSILPSWETLFVGGMLDLTASHSPRR